MKKGRNEKPAAPAGRNPHHFKPRTKDTYSNALHGRDDDQSKPNVQTPRHATRSVESDEIEGGDEEISRTETGTDLDYRRTHWEELKARRERRERTDIFGVPTGFPELDQATGGLRGLVFLAGEAGSDTTSLALQICRHSLKADEELGVVYYSMGDMNRAQMIDRMICAEARCHDP